LLGAFVIASAGREYVKQFARVDGRRLSAATRVLQRDPGYWGGQMAHVGVALLAVGIAASSGLASRDQVRVAGGETVRVDDYCIVYETATTRIEPNRRVDGARFSLRDADCTREIEVLEPVFNQYSRPPAVATPAVHTGLREDVFIALAGVPGEDVVIDVFIFPLMWVLWLGGLITVAGGMWAVMVKKIRRKVKTPRTEEPSSV